MPFTYAIYQHFPSSSDSLTVVLGHLPILPTILSLEMPGRLPPPRDYSSLFPVLSTCLNRLDTPIGTPCSITFNTSKNKPTLLPEPLLFFSDFNTYKPPRHSGSKPCSNLWLINKKYYSSQPVLTIAASGLRMGGGLPNKPLVFPHIEPPLIHPTRRAAQLGP